MASIIRGSAEGALRLAAGTGQTIELQTDALGTIDLASVATQGYVDAQIGNVIDTAPDALNTLNELAAALGDDENFASTVTTSLSGKADIATVNALTTTEITEGTNQYFTAERAQQAITTEKQTVSVITEVDTLGTGIINGDATGIIIGNAITDVISNIEIGTAVEIYLSGGGYIDFTPSALPSDNGNGTSTILGTSTDPGFAQDTGLVYVKIGVPTEQDVFATITAGEISTTFVPYTKTEVDDIITALDTYTKTEVDALTWDFAAHITGTPTDLSGYGITDAYTQSQVDTAITDAVATKQDSFVSAPASSVGAAGDLAGQIAIDSSYIYYCTADYTDGLSDIWARTALTLETW